MVRRMIPTPVLAFAAGSLLVTGAAAQSAAREGQDTVVDAVVVEGRKTAPGADAPKSAACEFLIANNPVARAQMALVAVSGNALAGPRIYLPTRPPRENDYAAAPKSAPGSPIPAAAARWRASISTDAFPYTPAPAVEPIGVAAGPRDQRQGPPTPNASQAGPGEGPSETIDQTGYGGTSEFTLEQAIDACRGVFARGGAPLGGGRALIARNDTTLPNGFVLFDEGRYDEALDQFKQAYAKLQHDEGGDEAALMIGKIYLRALRDKADPKEAVAWLRRAAEGPFNPTTSMPQFDPAKPENTTAMGEAAMMLAQIYAAGAPGVARNAAEARKWLARANEVGHVPAAKLLGDIYLSGREAAKDAKKAAAYYKQAATLGYAPAQFALGEIYYFGLHGGKSDVAKALAWYNEAAKLEEPNACYALAVAYDSGDGVPADPRRAVAFYRIAALKGHVPAMTALGASFHQGDLAPKDLATARRWFETAAKAGDGDAMFNLAAMMMKGEGGPADRAHAWAWFKLAQAAGKREAAAAVAAIERQMSAQEKAEGAKILGPQPA